MPVSKGLLESRPSSGESPPQNQLVPNHLTSLKFHSGDLCIAGRRGCDIAFASVIITDP